MAVVANGSSTAFIEAVSPEYVIFSAGHAHRHPWNSAAQRYLIYGVAEDKMFRTDRGDNEVSDDEAGMEWPSPGAGEEPDKIGDDDVDVLLPKEGAVVVEYRNPE